VKASTELDREAQKFANAGAEPTVPPETSEPAG
jgi:hypothetical protein